MERDTEITDLIETLKAIDHRLSRVEVTEQSDQRHWRLDGAKEQVENAYVSLEDLLLIHD